MSTPYGAFSDCRRAAAIPVGLIVTCMIGITGAICGGWAAATVFHVHSLDGFFSPSTWLTAIAGSAVLLAAYRAVDARTGHRMIRR
jgi:uncharacterized membrane protein YeaQ/YmgE (transglycosylase-associated protein family)